MSEAIADDILNRQLRRVIKSCASTSHGSEMSSYSFTAPETVDEAVSTLRSFSQSGQRTQILAGGTDVLVQMRSVDRQPRVIVDIKQLDETNKLDIGSDEIYIGAAIASGVLNENPELKSLLPGVIEAADLIGSTQIQGRASIGGNLCNSSPAGDTIPALIAASGVCVIAGSKGVREVVIEDFLTGVGTNCLQADEFLLGIKFPRPSPRTADAYLRFIPRTEMDIAVAGAGVSVTLDDAGVCSAARVAIGAVAPTALLVPGAAEVLIGTKVDDEALRAAGKACSDASSPISDKRGTKEYRIHVVGVLCRRAGTIARDRVLAR